MDFLTPIPAIIAAALALPALLLLYFLKLRRRPQRVATTMLWEKSIEDLQVNVPFQRLRLSLLFFLQLLILTLLLLAMARPVIESGLGESARLILIIDRSASMNAVDPGFDDRTRLDRAKADALRTIENLGRGETAGEVMIIALARDAHVISAFESNRSVLRAAIERIAPTDEPADFNTAIELANAWALTASDESAALPNVVLLSDGSVNTVGIAAEDRLLRANDFHFARIGPDDPAAVDNLGIVTLSGRRVFDDPAQLSVFVRVANAGSETISAALALRVDGSVVRNVVLSVPPASPEAPGETTHTFTIDLPRGGLISGMLNYPDALAADNIATLVIPPPRPPRVLLVAPNAEPDPFLRTVLESFERIDLEVRSLEAFDARGAAGPAPADDDEPREIDLVIFDRVTPAFLPPAPSLSFGGPLPGIDTTEPAREGGARLLSWDRRHPLLRHVELDDLVYSDFGGFVIPEDDRDRYETLATGPDGPVIIATRRSDAPHVAVGFDLLHSNWPADVSLVVFMQNVMDVILLRGRINEGVAYQPGETVIVRPQPGAQSLTLSGPVSGTIPVEDRERVTLPVMRRVGLLRVEGAIPEHETIAFNLTSAGETDIRPRPEVTVNAERVGAASAAEAAARELWPYLVAAALVLLVAEWLLYAGRVRV